MVYELTGIYWIKNETKYLPEWIEFHLMQGFDHFIFYDNGSTDHLEEVMEPYGGLVEIRKYPDPLTPVAKSGPQNAKNFWLMDYCLDEQKGKSKWIHYHAVDEFTFMVDGSKVTDFLKEYEDVGGLSIEWELFNSNGHDEPPKGLVIENYTQAIRDLNHHVKTIVMPDKAISTNGTPHNFCFTTRGAQNENHDPVDRYCNTYSFTNDKIKNHHYLTRSKREYEEKNNKGVLDFGIHNENVSRGSGHVNWQFVHNPLEEYRSTVLLKYVEPVRKAILDRYAAHEDLLHYINH